MVHAAHRRDLLVLVGHSTGSAAQAVVSVELLKVIVRLGAKRTMGHASRIAAIAAYYTGDIHLANQDAY
jgi:hypothetical protein